jgi:sulfonate transport system substrate-binding protein
MKMKNRWLTAALGLLAVVALLALAGCGSSGSSSGGGTSGGGSSEGTLTVGVLPGFLLKQAMEASGEEKGLDYKIEWKECPAAGPQFMEYARAGAVDIGLIADTPLIFGQVAKSPVKAVAAKEWIAPGSSEVGILVPSGSDVKSLAELKGKKVAVGEGELRQYYWVKALEEAGITEGEISAANLTVADSATALKAGQVDAAIMANPFMTQALEEGATSIAASSETLPSELLFWTVTEDALSSKSKEVKDFIERMAAAEEWTDSHPEQWAKIYAEAFQVEPAVAQKVVTEQKTNYVDIDQEVIENQQAEADTFEKLGLLEGPLDVKDEFDTQFNGIFTGGKE